MQYAVINSAGTVVNVIEWDGETAFPVGSGESIVESDNVNCHVGGTYSDGVFSEQAELVSNGSLINPVPATE